MKILLPAALALSLILLGSSCSVTTPGGWTVTLGGDAAVRMLALGFSRDPDLQPTNPIPSK